MKEIGFTPFLKGVNHSDIQQEGDAVGVPYYWPARQIPGNAERIQVAGRPFFVTVADAHCGCGRGKCTHAAIWPADCEAVTAEQPHPMNIDPDRTPGRQKVWVRRHDSKATGAKGDAL